MYYRVPFRLSGFFNTKVSLWFVFSFLLKVSFPWCFLFSCGQGFWNATLDLCKATRFLSMISFNLPYLRSNSSGFNYFSYVTSKLRNYISSASSVTSTHKGYCHLLAENLKSNFVDDAPCSRTWIFLLWHWCCHPFMVIHNKADNPLRYCNNRLLTEFKETNQSCSALGFLLRCSGHVIFSIYLIFLLEEWSGIF